MSKLYTMVGMEPGKMPEIKLQSRPFSDCYSVGKMFLQSVILGMFGNVTGNGFVTYTDKVETVAREDGTEYQVCTQEAKFFGTATLASCYSVED